MQITDELLQHEVGTLVAERRGHPRTVCDNPASLRVLSPVPGEMMAARILNVSKGGLKLRVPVVLVPGTLVHIHLKTSIAMGEVRYSLSVEGQQEIGVIVRDIFPKQ